MRYFELNIPYQIRKVKCNSCIDFPNIVTRHNHEIFEINTVTKGSLCFKVDEKEYTLNEGETIIINPFSLHSAYWKGCDKGEFISLTFNIKTFLAQKFSVELNQTCDLLLSGKRVFDTYSYNLNLQSAIIKLLDISRSDESYHECLAFSVLFEILHLLFQHHFGNTLENKQQNQNNNFLRETTNYIYQNYTKDISTTDIANHLFMSPSVFCHTFKRNFGTNFTDYLCEYRINLAIELYRKNRPSLTEIAYTVGFSSYSYFSKMFKKYIGISPAVYFGKRKNTTM